MMSGLIALALASATRAQPSTALRHDAAGRPVISARINDRGPYDMVVDTAAQASLLSIRLATELKLRPLDQQVAIAGAAGGGQAEVYPVDRFTTDLFDDRFVGMPGLPNADTLSAGGIIGIERFVNSKLVFDRSAARLSVAPSGPVAADYVALKGKVVDGLLTVPLIVNGVTIQALVDSGAGVTVANAAAAQALGFTSDDARLASAGALRGAGTAMTEAKVGTMDKITLGPVSFGGVPMIFSDVSAIGASGPGAAPSIILGSNLLNLLLAYAVDLPRGELQIKLPPRPAAPGK